MRPLAVPEVEQTKDTLWIYRSFQKVRDAVNTIIGTISGGTISLVAGTATVRFANLTPSSVIFVTRQRSAGTPGYIYADPLDYNLQTHTFVIRSTSASDTSLVAWLHYS